MTNAPVEPAIKLLAIETTAVPGSLALAVNGQVVREESLPEHPRAAASLAPTLQRLLTEMNWQPSEIRVVSVVVGPGSFTAVRIGVVTAKMLAYAVGADVVAINALDAVAARMPFLADRLAVLADAQRGQAVGRVYARGADRWELVAESGPVDPQALLKSWADSGSFIVSGPGLHRFAGNLADEFHLAPTELWNPLASSVAKLAWERYQRGERDDLWTLKPVYYRPSYAEEKRSGTSC